MKYYGIYQGFVTSIQDPEKRGRIKCTCPEVLDTSESGWCEPCFPNARDSGGDFYLPPLEEGVWIMFIDGDVDRPVYLGGWWSDNSTPLGTSYTNLLNARIISHKGTLIVLDDDGISVSIGTTPILTIEDDKVTIHCDLKVEGTIINS